ncbi:hypothetical protein [Pseudomonas syringae]|nr:hypothetical protein [Pseudomonas syringae]
MKRLEAQVGTYRWYGLAVAGAMCGSVLGAVILLCVGKVLIWLVY